MPKPSLCLNMIVKNEAARIVRCLSSVHPYIKSYSILDTGSTDGTPEIIEDYFKSVGIPGHVHRGVFTDFSQARNMSFANAQADNRNGDAVWCQFALLCDADMQLVVTDPSAFDSLDATAGSYDMMQKGGSVSYANRRIVNLDWPKPPYVGVTHEYIDVPATAMIQGASFIDHADGANRVEKYPRDAALLEAALVRDPDNGRYWYYLGNTYRDWGKPSEAIVAYQRRLDLGGWDEETHSAMMYIACCWEDLGNENAFVGRMIEAYGFRPQRAEPLYQLAKYYREKGNNAASLLFSKAGVNIKAPDDILFVNNFVYDHGLRYEYSICGYYDPKERARAFAVTDDLALDPTCPEEYRLSARNNLFHFTRPLATYCHSFKATRLKFTAPDGYTAMNPSVEECNGKIKCNIRCVNYTMDQDGRYIIHGGGDVIDTRNFLVGLDDRLNVTGSKEIVWSRPDPLYNLVTGLEDIRLWRYKGDLWFNACVREQSMFGTCQQGIGRLDQNSNVTDFEIVSGDSIHEKNWMHFRDRQFFYRLDTIVDPYPASFHHVKNQLRICVDNISGSSQAIRFKAGWLAVVHEAIAGPDGKRTYWHRFAWFEHDGKLRRLSVPFVFFDKQIEFCAGLAYHPNGNDLMISFGVRDAEAYVATVSIEDVALMCWKFHED